MDNNKKRCKSIDLFNKYGVENCKIILLEKIELKSKEELRAKEAEFIRKPKCINRSIPTRTKQQYYNENKESILKKQHQKYMENIDEMHQKRKQLREKNKELINCECGSCIYKYKIRDHKKTKKHLDYLENNNLNNINESNSTHSSL